MRIVLLFFFLTFTNQLVLSQEFFESQAVGGKSQLREFISQELVYPEDSYSRNIEGKVFFIFDIDEKGHTHNLREISFPDSSTYKEALRIFRLIEWVPAHRGGISIPDMNHFELEFNKKKYERLCKQRQYYNIVNPYEPVDSSLKVYWYRNLDQAPYPIFTDTHQTLAGYIMSNLKYPELAIKQNVTGIVKMSFIIETNGKISNVEIVNSVGAGCNEEAVRILRMLKWMPGVYNNRAVRTRTTLTISFNLDRGNDGLFNPNIKSSYGS